MKIGVIMRYTTIESLAIDTTDNFEGFVRVVANSVETIYDKENTYSAEDSEKRTG